MTLFLGAVAVGFGSLSALEGLSLMGLILTGIVAYAWHAARTDLHDTSFFQTPLFYSGLCYLVVINGFAATGALGGMLFVTGLYVTAYFGTKFMVRAYE